MNKYPNIEREEAEEIRPYRLRSARTPFFQNGKLGSTPNKATI